MADYSIGAEQVGVYEIPLRAGVVVTVQVTGKYGFVNDRLQVSVHDGSSPVYVKSGDAVEAKDPTSSVVVPGTWMEMRTSFRDNSTTVALVSNDAATVSVYRA
jgi:hypothetical protein